MKLFSKLFGRGTPDTIILSGPTTRVNTAESKMTGLFRSNPYVFIMYHACTLSPELADADVLMGKAFDKTVHGAKGECWEYVETGKVVLSARLQDDPSLPNAYRIVAYEGDDQPRVAFLPWYPERCTYTYIDPHALLCLTGPLTGCQIYVAEKKGFPAMLLHANANDQDSDVKSNQAAKDSMADEVVRHHGYTITRRLARGTYEPGAFVWGARQVKAGGWEYYVHDQQQTGGRNRPLPGA